MFNRDFYPTPPAVIARMTEGLKLAGKVVWEPEAGKCDIVDYLKNEGAEVIACEIDPDLQIIVKEKCTLIASDMLTVTSDQISHISYIIMNPPFSAEEKHILHAWEIAPPGCKIIALCNSNLLRNKSTKGRERLVHVVNENGMSEEIGECFVTAQRSTEVEISLITLNKPGADYETEFEGFFTDEEEEAQENGIMSYNVIRELVNRYVSAVKIFDEQLQLGVRMSNALGPISIKNPNQKSYDSSDSYLAFTASSNGIPIKRAEFKKALQINCWSLIFERMNLQKYATRGLKEDINKFVQQQQNIPFTMRNVYRMIDIVIGTAGQRMDKAILEVFEKVTSHSAENKHKLEGWKTNSHYLLTKKFILPSYEKEALIQDLVKALCYITGENYDQFPEFDSYLRYPNFLVDKDGKFLNDPGYDWPVKYHWHDYELKNDPGKEAKLQKIHPGCKIVRFQREFGKWFDWSFFRVKTFMKGTIHMEFKDEEVWAKFNQRVAKIKGYPLFEAKQQTAYQNRQTGRAQQSKASGWKGGAAQPKGEPKQATILFSAKIA